MGKGHVGTTNLNHTLGIECFAQGHLKFHRRSRSVPEFAVEHSFFFIIQIHVSYLPCQVFISTLGNFVHLVSDFFGKRRRSKIFFHVKILFNGTLVKIFATLGFPVID